MESKRQAKFAKQVQRDLSGILLKEANSMLGGKHFITVSQVRVTPDLGYVKAYLSFINEKEPEKMVNIIRQYSSEIRGLLGRKLRHEVKKIPELEFFYDDTAEYVEKMEKIFKELHDKEEKESE